MKLSDKAKLNTRKGLLFIIIMALVVLWLLPILFLLLVSFKTSGDYAISQIWDMPQKFALFTNIRYVLIETNLIRPFLNSLIYALVSGMIAIFFSSLAA